MQLPTFPLVEWFAVAEGRHDLSLSHSACRTMSVADLLTRAELAEFRQLRLGYGEFSGMAPLRESIAETYETIEPAEIVTFNGPSEAVYTSMRALLRPGDRVVVPGPAFHTLQAIARVIGCEVRVWQAREEEGFAFHVSELEDLCDERTKLIVINFPHNPTGQTISGEALSAVVEIAKRSRAMLFSDEAFRLLEYPPDEALPAACDLYEYAISVTGLSKPFGLGGLRIGWLATRSAEILTAVQKYRYYTAEMTNTPCQWLASRALERAEEILPRNRGLIRSNLNRLSDFVAKRADVLRLHRPQAGTMALVEQRSGLSSTGFCRRLLDDERLFAVPGAALGMADTLLRFGLGISDLGDGLERLDRVLNRITQHGR